MIAGPSSCASLLIVDDNDAFSQMLAWEFQGIGYQVQRRGDCGQARATARTRSFDCALIDFHLPDGDGRMLSRWLKQISPGLRIVMMTCDRDRATAGGPEWFRLPFVDKPVPTVRVHRLFGGRTAGLRPLPIDRLLLRERALHNRLGGVLNDTLFAGQDTGRKMAPVDCRQG